MNEQRCFLSPFWLCLGGASIEKHHFQTPILRMTSFSKNSLTTFPQCQHHSFLTYLQFRTALVQQLEPRFLFVCLCLCVCFWQRSGAWKRWESMWQRRRWYSWSTPKHFKEELIPKPRRVEVNIHFLLLEDVDPGPDSVNNLRHEHCRQVIWPPSAFSFLL